MLPSLEQFAVGRVIDRFVEIALGGGGWTSLATWSLLILIGIFILTAIIYRLETFMQEVDSSLSNLYLDKIAFFPIFWKVKRKIWKILILFISLVKFKIMFGV